MKIIKTFDKNIAIKFSEENDLPYMTENVNGKDVFAFVIDNDKMDSNILISKFNNDGKTFFEDCRMCF